MTNPNAYQRWKPMQIDYPCKDCKNRTEGCHSTCEEYLTAKASHEQIKKKTYEDYNNESTINTLAIERYRKGHRR